MTPTTSNAENPLGDVLEKIELREPPHSRVFLHNDDYTTMDFVVQVLCSVFHKTQD